MVEFGVFLFLILPSMAVSFFIAGQEEFNFRLTAMATIFRDLALVCLVAYFAWRNGEPMPLVGWRFRDWEKEAFIGFVLFFFMYFAAGALGEALKAAGLPAAPAPRFNLDVRTPSGMALAVSLVTVVAFAEETIFRGYMILRLRNLARSAPAAVILSSVIFSLGHGYEGISGVITVAFIGIVLALVYMWRKSLLAPMVMHFMQDFAGIVLAPLLGKPH